MQEPNEQNAYNSWVDHQKFEDMLHDHRWAFRQDDHLARELYSSLCNMQWQHEDSEKPISYSWRSAGGLVADIRKMGEDYLDFYCSGGENLVSKTVLDFLGSLGWHPVPWDDDELEVVDTIEYKYEPVDEEALEALIQTLKKRKTDNDEPHEEYGFGD